jgi:hypothetical protein
MSHSPISLSPDLKRLREEGYFIQVNGGHLVMREVPYLDNQLRIRRGTLVSTLVLAGNVTQTPDTHVVFFDGEKPCDASGKPLAKIIHEEGTFAFGTGLSARFRFSSKPAGTRTTTSR